MHQLYSMVLPAWRIGALGLNELAPRRIAVRSLHFVLWILRRTACVENAERGAHIFGQRFHTFDHPRPPIFPVQNEIASSLRGASAVDSYARYNFSAALEERP